MHRPDFDALRACLATVKALDIETTPVWMMLLGPAGVGKTAYYIRCCESYPRYEMTDEMTVAGVMSGSARNFGKGLLERLGERGLWLMPDFTVVLNMRDDRRNELLGIQRRIFDGKYDRLVDGEQMPWKGRIHVVAACTPAIERFYRVNADMGERFLQIRIERCEPSDDLVRKVSLQRNNWQQFQDEIVTAARNFLNLDTPTAAISFALERRILDWADFISLCRTTVHHNYKDDIDGVGHEEGSSRICQQLTGLAVADATLMGQEQVSESQLALVERISMDCLPSPRRAILKWFHTDESLLAPEVQQISGIAHPFTFQRTIDELQAIGCIVKEGDDKLALSKIRLSARLKSLLAR